MITASLTGENLVIAGLNSLVTPLNVQRAVNIIAESWVDDTHGYIDAGRAYHVRPQNMHSTGQLYQSIGWHGNGDGTATVYANADYARYVEFGTRPARVQPVRPKPGNGRKALKIPVAGGGFIFRRSVRHKGSKPYPFFYADSDGRSQRAINKVVQMMAGLI
jgi:hypothetical protein